MITIFINGVEVTMPQTARINMVHDRFNASCDYWEPDIEIDAR
jgi:hypothetical protein